MRYFCICLLLLIFAFACNLESGTKSGLISIPEPKVITPEKLQHDLIMQQPLEIKSFGDYLFFTQPLIGKPVLFYNKNTGKDRIWGQAGNGPDDFISASCIYHNEKDSIIKLYDRNLRKVVSYKFNIHNNHISLIPKDRKSIHTDSISILGLHEMDNGYYVSMAAYGSKDMFVLLDSELKVQKTFGDKPIEKMQDGNYMRLYGWFASFGSKLYYATQAIGYLVCYDIDKECNITKEWELQFNEPKYEISNESFRWNKENKLGFYDIQTNDKYIFLAYSGKPLEEEETMPNSILVLGHNGKLIKHIKYDKENLLAKFTLVGDDIYAIGYDHITKFNWKNALR